jgi:putative membrane protein
MMFFGGLLGLVLIGVVVLLLLGQTDALKNLNLGGRQQKSPGGEDDALRILKERYARGDISQDEYEQMRRTLQD